MLEPKVAKKGDKDQSRNLQCRSQSFDGVGNQFGKGPGLCCRAKTCSPCPAYGAYSDCVSRQVKVDCLGTNDCVTGKLRFAKPMRPLLGPHSFLGVQKRRVVVGGGGMAVAMKSICTDFGSPGILISTHSIHGHIPG